MAGSGRREADGPVRAGGSAATAARPRFRIGIRTGSARWRNGRKRLSGWNRM